MNSSYDTYMCRKESRQCNLDAWLCQFVHMSEKQISDHLWKSFAEKVSKNGFLKQDSNGRLVRGGK
jgi:hypothetical protein